MNRQEVPMKAAHLARAALRPEVLCGNVLVWDAGQAEPRNLVYVLEGWDQQREAWIANDTLNPGEPFQLGDIADTNDVKCFAYFLIGLRGCIHEGETIEHDSERFARFESVGGILGDAFVSFTDSQTHPF